VARKLGEAFVAIKADMSDLKKGLDEAAAETKKAVRTILRSLNLVERALGGLIKVGAGLSVGLTLPIVLASRSFVRLGSAANELENRFSISFGNMTEEMNEWASRLSDAVGRSAIDTKDFAASFNTMIGPLRLGADAASAMAKELTKLTFDLGSIADLTPEASFRKLQSALAGQFRPLQRYAESMSAAAVKTFALDNGIIALGETMNETQKLVARFGLVTETLKFAMGDAIRTGQGWQNQWERLLGQIKDMSSAMGQIMIPTLLALLRVMNVTIIPLALWVVEFVKLHPLLGNVATAVALLVAVLGPLLIISAGLLLIYIKIRFAFKAAQITLGLFGIKVKGTALSVLLFTKALGFARIAGGWLRVEFIRMRTALTALSARFRLASISSISFAAIWTGAAGVIAGAAALVAGAFRLMWAAILGPAGLAIIAITALAFLIEHLLAKSAMKGLAEETDALNKALKALKGGAAGGAGDTGGGAGFGRTVSTPVLGLLAGGGEGFSRIFAGAAGAIGIKPKGDQLVAGKLDRTNELLAEIAGNGMSPALVLA